MKVLYLTPQPLDGTRFTSVSFLEEELEALADSGLDMHVLSESGATSHDGSGGSRASGGSTARGAIRAHVIPPGRDVPEAIGTLGSLLKQIPRLGGGALTLPARTGFHFQRVERFAARVVREEGIDVIHSHFGWPGGWGGIQASLATGIPVVATFRGMDLNLKLDFEYGLRRDRHFRTALPFLLRRAALTAYPSEYMRAKGLELGAPKDRTRVVLQGVDTERFRPAGDSDRRALKRRLLGGTGKEALLLSVGMLVRHKGVHHTLDALSRLDRETDWTLVVCGEGPELKRLEEDAERLGLGSRIRFIGYVDRDRIPDYFAAADIHVHSALFEAAGNVLLEAMASGRPVVCSDAGGPPDYVVDGETGWIVPPADPGAMALAIQRLLDSPELADRMGMRGRARAERRLQYGAMIDRIRTVYREAIS